MILRCQKCKTLTFMTFDNYCWSCANELGLKTDKVVDIREAPQVKEEEPEPVYNWHVDPDEEHKEEPKSLEEENYEEDA